MLPGGLGTQDPVLQKCLRDRILIDPQIVEAHHHIGLGGTLEVGEQIEQLFLGQYDSGGRRTFGSQKRLDRSHSESPGM